MSNFLFNPIKVAMLDGSGGFDWLADDIVGVLYDSRIVITPTMIWADISTYEVARSAAMDGRSVSTDGRAIGSTLHFSNVTTAPGLRIKGMLLVFDSTDGLIAHFDDGLDGFSGNTDLSIEAEDLEIFARTSASNAGTWLQL